jgi:hypothetical protein
MKKMITLYKLQFKNGGAPYAINKINEKSSWALTEGIATRKFDGTSCAIIEGKLYKRFDKKKGRVLPKGGVECCKADKKTGHHPHWVPCLPDDKHHWEAFEKLEEIKDGTFELCGPKIQKNKEQIEGHCLIEHGRDIVEVKDRTFEGIKRLLEEVDMEGFVFHHPDGRMCKIRKKDFGIKR